MGQKYSFPFPYVVLRWRIFKLTCVRFKRDRSEFVSVHASDWIYKEGIYPCYLHFRIEELVLIMQSASHIYQENNIGCCISFNGSILKTQYSYGTLAKRVVWSFHVVMHFRKYSTWDHCKLIALWDCVPQSFETIEQHPFVAHKHGLYKQLVTKKGYPFF